MLKFNTWSSLTEGVVAFDPAANYPDKLFGYTVGSVDTAAVVPGGEGGDWGGSMPRALWFARVADDWAASKGKTKSLIMSQKRSRVLTASGNTSDHFKGNSNAYAVDIAASGATGDALLAHIMQKFGHPEYRGGSWFDINKNGYRYQIGWKVKNHFDHIHVGVKKIGSTRNNFSNSGNTLGAKLLNNPNIRQWFNTNMPGIASTLTPEMLDQALIDNPQHFEWFRTTFSLNSNGDPDSSGFSKKIKSNYTGQAASNIDLLVNEMTANGITNKYAIIGMLSTIGKESGFIPKNEIPYTDTDNSRIRKIFGSRVKDLSDADLTKLKSNPSKFWDRVYGPDDPTGKSQQYGNTNPGDGEKYLGRGFNGITFKSGYAKYGKIVGIDLVSNPNQLNDPRIASKAAVAFFLNGIKAKGVDPNSFTNKRDAIRAFVQVNAGLGTNIEGSETLANAEKVSNNFTL
jgi:predicted chitinase